MIEKGWNCVKNANNKSICTLDGSMSVQVQRVYKYGGENKIKLYLALSIPIKLNTRYLLVTITGLSNSNSVSW